jgi:hypothetical protein
VILWAGKALSDEEAETTRRLVGLLARAGEADAAEGLARFLPDSGHAWSPDELEQGAHAGPWLALDAEVDGAPPEA